MKKKKKKKKKKEENTSFLGSDSSEYTLRGSELMHSPYI